jgi:hypothetical protein
MDEGAMMSGAVASKTTPKAVGATSPKVEKAYAADVPPPEQPLPPDLVNSYVAGLNQAYAALTPGEEFPPAEFRADAPVTEIPDDVKARTLALCQFLKKFPQAKGYDLDPVATLTTPQGMSDATTALVKLAGDQAVIRALTRGAPMKGDDETAETTPDNEQAEGE